MLNDMVQSGLVPSGNKSKKFVSIYEKDFKPKQTCTNLEWKNLPLHIQVCYSYQPIGGLHYLLYGK